MSWARKDLQFRLNRMTSVVSPLPPDHIVNGQNHKLTKMKKTSKEKYKKLFKLIVLTAIPTLIVIAQSVVNLNEDYQMYHANRIVKEGIQQTITISDVIHQVQIERGTSALYVTSNGDPFVRQRLVTYYGHTDVAITSLSTVSLSLNLSNLKITTEYQLQEYIAVFRQNLQPENTTLNAVIQFYTEINVKLIELMSDRVRMKRPFSFWTELAAYQLIIASKEEAGIERALGSTYFARGFRKHIMEGSSGEYNHCGSSHCKVFTSGVGTGRYIQLEGALPVNDLLWYNEKNVLGLTLLDQGLKFSAHAKDLLRSSISGTNLVESLSNMREDIRNNTLSGPSIHYSTLWFDNMTTYIDILKYVQESLASSIVKSANQDISHLKNQLIASSVQLCVAVIMMPVVLVLVRNIVNISSKLKERTFDLEEEKQQTEKLLTELEDERKRTEALLHQLLPKSVATTLMENGSVDPESFSSVTIMFSDVVGFTKIASSSTPMEVVQMLNKLYKIMDGHVERFDVYKVETIGDAYMVASGLPKRNGENHVAEIAELSISLQTERLLIPHRDNEAIHLRIGFNTGPCVAGVVGIRMPRYCIFGDTVNTASRMESTGLPFKIQMTQSSADKLLRLGRFIISKRGEVVVKGKGVMVTYWLEGKALP